MKKIVVLAGLVLASTGIASNEARAGKPCEMVGNFCFYEDGDRVEYVNRSDLEVIGGTLVRHTKIDKIYGLGRILAPAGGDSICDNEAKASARSKQHLRDLLAMGIIDNNTIKIIYRLESQNSNLVVVGMENRFGSIETQMVMDKHAVMSDSSLSMEQRVELRRKLWCAGSN